MSAMVPNLEALVELLREGSAARELVEAFRGLESLEECRACLGAVVQARLEAKLKELSNADDHVA
ncbi:MAG: hypothetical protein JXB46_04885 [Candidatus Eisenbacteria bacterium]|nr:hypothetical protein [Candidatus Eisenbacteria bacterium]